jgi:hypothetical protein
MGLGSIVEVKRQESRSCEGKLIAKAKIIPPELLASDLPNKLEKQLISIMSNIASFHQKTADKRDDTNVKSRKLSGYFGTVIAKSFSDNSIKINKVIPKSLAEKIKLQEGDLITKLGGDEFDIDGNTPSEVVNHYLKNRVYGEEITVELVRGSHRVILRGNYIPVVIPEASYSIGKKLVGDVINQTKLSAQLTFSFEQLLLAINNHYQSSDQSDKMIIIQRPSFELVVNLASVNNAQKIMLAESLKKTVDLHEIQSKEHRSSGVLNSRMGG